MHAQVNSRYVPQLQEVLQWPQSVGIVGGRPSSSLYFIGHQGQSVLFMDPHEVQDVRRPSHTFCACGLAVKDALDCISSNACPPQTPTLGRTMLSCIPGFSLRSAHLPCSKIHISQVSDGQSATGSEP